MASGNSRSHSWNTSDHHHVEYNELKDLDFSRRPTDLSSGTELLGQDHAANEPLVAHMGYSSKHPEVVSNEIPDPLDRNALRRSPTWRRKLQGWRFGLALNTSTATLVLVINIMLVGIAGSKNKLDEGIGSLYVGDCAVVDNWNIGLHLVINALSSVLLSASNYAMQCVSSPTRPECDAAHKRGDWLDIGIAGTRNLSRIGLQRRIIWVVLAVSSVPLHLLYNSAVFKTLDANNHIYAVVSEELMNAPALDASQLTSENRGMETARLAYQQDTDAYERLDPDSCIAAYSGAFVSGHSNVLLITTDQGYDYSKRWPPVFGTVDLAYTDVHEGPLTGATDWLCNERASLHGSCDDAQRTYNPSNWTMLDYKIDYCYSRKTEPHCKLQFSIYIMIPVIICNLLKVLSMSWTLFRQREATFVTFGDALASWLDEPDASTKDMCLMGKRDIVAMQESQQHNYSAGVGTDAKYTLPPTTFSRSRVGRWSEAVSSKRWYTTMVLCSSTVIGACFLLFTGYRGAISLGNPISNGGFGTLNTAAIVNIGMPQLGSAGLVGCVMLANLPQVILSMLYLMYNGLFTCMHLAHEYSGYATERKPLRVTEPEVDQRATYWLQLPYTYGIPLLAASSILHWLVSQSIFLARVTVWADGEGVAPVDAPGRNDHEYVTASAIGYSCAPMLFAIITGAVMLFTAFLMGFRKLPSYMPIAGSCSAAIAAAAHRPKSDVNASVLPVKWGAVADAETERSGHTCFSSEDVIEMQDGKVYAYSPCLDLTQRRNAKLRNGKPFT